ncbi:MAG: signal peptide peptidase SppA, partial [Candidatus ainarchaeum sp.]|nr:signal peptide peptidase SppA [Candidatus ainarchaeum sp.]
MKRFADSERKPRGALVWALLALGTFAATIMVLALAAGIYGALVPPADCVGVIRLEGEIVAGSSAGGIFSGQLAGSDDFVALVGDAKERGEVKAVLIEINTPGGSAVGTSEMYSSVKELGKPTVSYFREVAASGGYYVAAGTDYIVSDPDCITGSIGARSTAQDLSGLFQKIGYNSTVIASGAHKDMGDPSRPMDEEEIAIMQSIVDEVFQEFRATVEEGRRGKLDSAEFSEVLDGRIVTGRQAKAIGLVDELGNRKAALRKAAALGNVTYSGDSPPVCEITGNRVFPSPIL